MGNYHLIGIKGTGMAALAITLKQLGHKVSGSDIQEDFFTAKALVENNIKVKGFAKKNIVENIVYIISAAYQEDNIEVKKVFEKGYKYYYYHEFIEEFFTGIRIGISGVHGKTTTTYLTTRLFSEYNISAIIGDGTGIGNKAYEYFIFEACEYKDHFLNYHYDYLVINNIDHDHPDYFKDLDAVINSFALASKKTKVLIVNGDDENTNNIDHDEKYTFGFNEDNFVKCEIIKEYKEGYLLNVEIEKENYQFLLPFAGRYMIYNFLASLSIYYLAGGDMELIKEKVSKLKLPKRRMEEYVFGNNIIIDDYAHHPTEIKSLLSSVKSKYSDKQIIAIFQPHTYSRTIHLKEDFKHAFVDADKVYIAKTFTSKREKYNHKLEKQVRNIFKEATKFSSRKLKRINKLSNNVIIFMGAGNIHKFMSKIIDYKS